MDDQDWNITCAELQRCRDSVVLVDVREIEEFAEGALEGAKLIPLGEILNRAEQELNKDDDIVLYCAHGIRSLHALVALQKLGFKKLRSLEGGIAAWEEAHGPTQHPR